MAPTRPGMITGDQPVPLHDQEGVAHNPPDDLETTAYDSGVIVSELVKRSA